MTLNEKRTESVIDLKLIIICEIERMWKEAIMTCVSITCSLHGETEENLGVC
jgi:hypothetical protein